MSDLIRDAGDWLEGQRRSHMASTVVYSRGGANASVPATVASTEFESIDENGYQTAFHSRDFIIAASDLGYASDIQFPSFGEPQVGDEITETVSQGSQITYMVIDLAGSDCFRWADQNRRAYRIHTKKV